MTICPECGAEMEFIQDCEVRYWNCTNSICDYSESA